MSRRFGWAWIGLALALAVHVLDEALNDFLSVYNPNALWIREHLHLPVPVFTFGIWLTGLILGVALLLALSVFAFRGPRWIRWAAVLLSILMILNGLNHMGGSLLLHRWMPGVFSSPLLIAASVWLLRESSGGLRRPA